MTRSAADRSSWFTRFAYLALLASLGFIQVPVTVFGQNVVLTDILFLVVAASWVLDLLRNRSQPRWHAFYWLLIIYLASLSFSCFFSADQRQSLSHLPGEIYLAGLTVVTADVVRGSAGLRGSITAWLLGTVFATMLGVATIALFYASPTNPLLDYLTYHYGAVPVGHYPRITSTFVSASMFCNYLNVSLLLAIVASASGWISKRVTYFLVGLILISAFFTISVELGGIFLGLGLAFYFHKHWTARPRSLALAASVVISIAFLFLSVVSLAPGENGSKQIAGVSFTPSGRVLVWEQAWQTFKDDLITGNGLGVPVANVLFKNSEGSYSLLTDAHNSYLSIGAQAGILGLVGIVAITVYILVKWREVIQRGGDKVILALGAAFFCAFVYQGLTGSFEHARHLWVLMGLFIAADRIERDQYQNS